MVEYSKEFVKKCKEIYPYETGLHSALDSKAWIVEKILPDLFWEFKENFILELIDNDFSCDELNAKIKKLREASKLESESKAFIYN